jgi:hypothetical protein
LVDIEQQRLDGHQEDPDVNDLFRHPRLRAATIALVGASMAFGLSVASADAASLPAHHGIFECSYDSAGNRVVQARLPGMTSFTSGEQVYWFGVVYKKTSSGYLDQGHTLGSRLATAWANQNGPVMGAFLSGQSWVSWSAGNVGYLTHSGGRITVGSAGTYMVAGYFYWSSMSTAWTGEWATYPGGGTGCTFSA